MSDSTPRPERPRPQYGEYASAQEQRARIRTPLYDEPVAASPTPAPVRPALTPPARWASSDAQKTAARQSVNRMITIALLAYGAFEVVRSVFGFLDPTATYDALYRMIGVPGSFSATSAVQPWLTISLVVLIGGYLVTALVSVLAMRAGRRSWWIPLVGAVVTYAVVSVLLTVPVYGDPAFQEYLSGLLENPQ
ncbi:hypothetical protein ET475_13755 [Microbacterium protaetiae]|uniref:Uncharacterized protein n=1 Tax=Microbacterium protaetiae TaxID=2509458 RepID=A0A4P6ESJ5_9MICO|nr:DUF6264 family protein [Microbacterium protaetiae]QAY60948.1 hypothetical protein ET475_13755 [Microbacterium protaetiae]